MSGIVGSTAEFHRKFMFLVEIAGITNAGFQDCSELSVETANIAYYEGGARVPIGLPGRSQISVVTLSRGAITGDGDLHDWYEQVVNITNNGGLVEPAFKRTVDILQLGMDGLRVIRRHRLFGAYPEKYVYGAWDNNADELTMESLALRVDAVKKIF